MSAIRKYIVALSRYAAAAATVITIAWASQTLGADGKWTNLAGGAWNTTGNWADGIVAGGTDAIADFSTLNLTAHASVSNDSPRTIGTLRFGDTTPSHNWTLTSSTLTLARGAGMPTIAVENQTATIASAVLGNQGLVKSGAGKLVLSGGINNNFSGPITVNNGILESYGGNSFKNTSGAISVAAGAVFNANGRFDGVAILNAINLSGNGVGAYGALNGQYNVNLTGPITLLTDTKITHDYNYFRISGPIVADGAGKNLELNVLVSGQYPIYVDGSMTLGTGTLTLNSVRNGGIGGGEFCAFDFKEANSYSGGTVLTNYATLRLRNAGALGSGGVTLYQGSWINLNTLSISVPWLCGTGGSIMDQGVAAGTSTLTVNQSVSTMFAGAISNGTSRVIALVKSGAGTLALAGQNNYSGATAVNAGKLIGVTGGACGSSVITVAGNATNGVRVASYGGQWACAGLTHNGGATALEFDFGRVPPCDWAAPLQVNGDLTINGAVGVVICNGVWGNTGTYPLVSYTGTLSGGVPAAPAAMPSGLVATLVSNTGEKRIDLVVTAVPAVVSPPAFVWSRLVGGKADGVWDEAVNWSPAGVPDGIDAVADFSTLDITASSVVTIASPRTVGTLLVSDIVPSGQTWTLDGGADKHLTLASSVGVPMIDVTNTEVFLGGFKGTNGLVKSGNGVLALYGNSYNNSLSGPIFVNSGALGTVNGLSFKYITGDIIVAAGASFVANGGNDYQLKSFNNIYLSGTGGTPSGYVTAQTPDGHYPSEPVPLGALDIHGSAFIEGVITLVTDSRITHGFNDGRINGVVRALEPGRNLELVTTTGGGHWGLAVNGRLNLGTGGLTLNSKVAGVSSGSNGARFFLNAANSYSGGTVLTNYANVRLGNVGALGSGGVTLYPDTCLNLFGQSVVIGGLSGTGGCITDTNGVAGTTTLTLNHSGATTFAGEISNGPIRTIALVKNGVGALTLSGTNTYTGATAVSNGTLTVNGALSSSAVTVCTGAAFGAGGTGVVGRAMLGGALTFQDSSALLVDLEPPLADAVVVSGDAVIGVGVEVRLSCNQDKAGSWQIIKTTAGTVQGSDPVLVGGLQGTTLTRTDTAIWLTIPPEGVILIVR